MLYLSPANPIEHEQLKNGNAVCCLQIPPLKQGALSHAEFKLQLVPVYGYEHTQLFILNLFCK
jgi:hypothetical protein